MALPTADELMSLEFISDGLPYLGNINSQDDVYTTEFISDGLPFIVNEVFTSAVRQKAKIIYFMWGN